MRYLLILFLLAGCASPMTYTEAKDKAWLVIHKNVPEGCRYTTKYTCKDKEIEKYLRDNGPVSDEVIPMIQDREMSASEAQWLIGKIYGCQESGGDTVCDLPMSTAVLTRVDGEIKHTEVNGKHVYKFIN